MKKAVKIHQGQVNTLTKDIKDEVELDELTADEKKLMAKMFDKKGNLTPLGKKVMDQGKREEEVEENTLDIEDESDYTLDEGKMKDLHGYISTGKSAEEIAKIMKIDVKTVKTLMNDFKHEGFSSDAQRKAAFASGYKEKDKKDKKEDVKVTEGYFDEQKSSTGYDLYHKDFSGAMQHAYAHAKKKLGIIIDPDEISDKVATGPSKPSKGKTNSYRLKGDKGSVQIQVYNMGSKFELNMYKESIDEAISMKGSVMQYYYVDPNGVVQAVGSKDAMRKMNVKQAKDGNKGGSFSQNSKKYKVGDKIKEEVELDENKNLIKDYEKYMSQGGKKDHNAIDYLMSMPKYKRMSKDQMAKTIGDAKRKGIFKEEVELDEKNKISNKEIDFELYSKEKGAKAANMIMNKEIRRASQMKDYKSARAYMDKFQDEYSELGAGDSEPTRAIDAILGAVFNEETKIDEVSKEGTLRVIDLARQNNPKVRDHLNVSNSGNKGYQVQRMTKGVFVNQGKPYPKLKDAQKVQQGGQHSMQFETIDESVKFAGMPAGLSKKRIKADRDVYAQVLGIKEAIDPADFDISATSKDKDNATKNIILQLRKVISLNGKNPVEFSSGKKEKVHPNVAAAALTKFEKLRRTDQKDEFQQKIAKSYKDLLNAVKGK